MINLRRILTLATLSLLPIACTGKVEMHATGGGGTNSSGGGNTNAGGGSSGGGIGSTGGGTAGTGGGTTEPFAPLSVDAAVGKVKNLLVGLPATDAEIAAVKNDPNALQGLVEGWMATDDYTAKMQNFFGVAFQQTQVNSTDFQDQSAGSITNGSTFEQTLTQNLRESFARTAIELIKEGKPFSDTMTTTRFMMTPPMMAYYAYLEVRNETDLNKTTNLILKADPTFGFTLESDKGVIPIEETLDAGSPNFMTFFLPGLPDAGDANCRQPERVYNKTSTINTDVTGALYGTLFGHINGWTPDGGGYRCNTPGNVASAYFTADDFTAWRMVTVRAPRAGEELTKFYDIPKMRTSNELVATTPRVGFYTTPAFFAGWQTNSSNQARVTVNQTMIVGVGKAFDGTLNMAPISEAALDADHAPTNSACYSCHQTLDPARQFFLQSFSYHFSPQTDVGETNLPGMFAFDGVSVAGTGIGDLGKQLSIHPRFAPNWVQRLCTYANSAPCDTTDPEFQRIVTAFSGSNMDWNVLVKNLFSSPIVTYLAETKTADTAGQTFGVSRRDHLCVLLSSRLHQTDICGLQPTTKLPNTLKNDRVIASILPSDQYSRGSETPVLANDPSLFFRSGVENICIGLANTIIDSGATAIYLSTSPEPAIQSFVHDVMGVSTDRDTVPLQILHDHNANALAGGATASNALKSTFVLACTSPSTIGVGQ